MRGIERLSDRFIRAPRKPGWYADGAGLYLRVTKDGTRSWVFRYMTAGKAHNMGLGALHTVTLAEAREFARRQRFVKLQGRDPIVARREAALTAVHAVPRFGEVAEAYIADRAKAWRDTQEPKRWRSTLATYAKQLIEMPVDKIEVRHVLQVIEPLWNDRPLLAKRIQTRIEAVLAAATVKGFRSGDNPAAWKGHLEHAGLQAPRRLAAVVSHRSLPWQEVPAFIAELRAAGTIAAKAAEFMILTAARPREALGTAWPEIAQEARTWTIPPERMKARREHRVPLSDRAVALLAEINQTIGDRVFPTSYKTLLRQIKKVRPDADPHGFRSSFADWARDNGVNEIVAEQCLAHVVGDQTKESYFRSDNLEQRRPIMEAWENFLTAR